MSCVQKWTGVRLIYLLFIPVAYSFFKVRKLHPLCSVFCCEGKPDAFRSKINQDASEMGIMHWDSKWGNAESLCGFKAYGAVFLFPFKQTEP